MALTAEQQKLVGFVIERAAQACRGALKEQNFHSGTNIDYRNGWESAVEECENAIREHVAHHIEQDLIDEK